MVVLGVGWGNALTLRVRNVLNRGKNQGGRNGAVSRRLVLT